MMSRLNKRGYNYDPKKNKFRTRKSKDNVKNVCYNCGKYGHLSYDYPEPSKLNKKQKIMTINTSHQRKVMRRRTTRRKGLSQEKRRSRLSLENGSRMVTPQMMTQVMKNQIKRLWGLPCMMMKMMVIRHLYLHHPCASWQEVTPR